MAINTAQFSEALWPGIEKWFGDSYGDWPSIWDKLVTTYPSDKQFEKYQGITNFGLAAVKSQGADITFQNPFQGFQREIQNVFYALGTTITYEMQRFNQYNVLKNLPQKLAQSIRRTEETVVANQLNNGFSTAVTPTLTADGLSLFNTGHILVAATGTTVNNTPTTASDFSQTALEQAYIDISNFLDDQGLPIVVTGQKLIVPTASQHLARKVLETDYEVNTANNTINPVANVRSNTPIELIVSPWLTDIDSWFIKTSEEDGIVFQEVDPVQLDRDNAFDSKNMKFSAMRGFGVGAVNYLGYYGSPGA